MWAVCSYLFGCRQFSRSSSRDLLSSFIKRPIPSDMLVTRPLLCMPIAVLAFILFQLVAGAPKKRRAEPIYGWCCVKHRPRVSAQSGYVDADGNRYCTSCYRKYCPDLFAVKHAKKRACDKGTCAYCGISKDLRDGFCKPCRNSRGCSTCGEVNMDPDAAVCEPCRETRASQGAHGERLAYWCISCASDAERNSGYCPPCLCFWSFFEGPIFAF